MALLGILSGLTKSTEHPRRLNVNVVQRKLGASTMPMREGALAASAAVRFDAFFLHFKGKQACSGL